MWVLDLFGFLLVVGLLFGIKNLIHDIWRDDLRDWVLRSLPRRY